MSRLLPPVRREYKIRRHVSRTTLRACRVRRNGAQQPYVVVYEMHVRFDCLAITGCNWAEDPQPFPRCRCSAVVGMSKAKAVCGYIERAGITCSTRQVGHPCAF